jgi:hypothetical protein
MFAKLHNSQRFLKGGTVVPFCSTQTFACIGNDSFTTILDLKIILQKCQLPEFEKVAYNLTKSSIYIVSIETY